MSPARGECGALRILQNHVVALPDEGRLRDIPIDMISQGASEINITFVVDESSIPTAVRELHDEFFSTVPGKGVFE